MRGYAPSSLPSDGSYHVGALMDDALRVLEAAGPTGRDVFIGHDWGAIAGPGSRRCPTARSRRRSSCPYRCLRRSGRSAGSPTPAGWPHCCRVSCCAAGTSCTSNCLGCQSVRRRGWCRGCGGNGRPDTAPTKTCATSTPRSAHRSGGAPRSAITARRCGAAGRRPSTPNCTALAVGAAAADAVSARHRRRLLGGLHAVG